MVAWICIPVNSSICATRCNLHAHMQWILRIIQILITLCYIKWINHLVAWRPLRLEGPNRLLVVGSKDRGTPRPNVGRSIPRLCPQGAPCPRPVRVTLRGLVLVLRRIESHSCVRALDQLGEQP